MSKFKPGDRVHPLWDEEKRGTVHHTKKGEVYVLRDDGKAGCYKPYWMYDESELNRIKEKLMRGPKFKIGDHVELIHKGSECTSDSLAVGDRGEIRRCHKPYGCVNYEYLITFNTCNGPRAQWVYEEHLSPASETLDSRIEALEKELEALKLKREEDQWEEITDSCSLNGRGDVLYQGNMIFGEPYVFRGMRVFKRKRSK